VWFGPLNRQSRPDARSRSSVDVPKHFPCACNLSNGTTPAKLRVARSFGRPAARGGESVGEAPARTRPLARRTFVLYRHLYRDDAPVADVNVTDLRQNLPAYLERARRGERIRVTSRGAVIAEITSPKATEEQAELIRWRLRRTVLRYDLPAEPAHAPDEWAVNQ
jgi:prevent-host-death family protein